MGVLSNVASSVTGKVNKALLCVKKMDKAKANESMKSAMAAVGAQGAVPDHLLPMLGGATSNVDLQAKLAASRKGFISSFTSVMTQAKSAGYHVMEVKYNPRSIQFYANSGNQVMSGPAGGGANMQIQSTMPAMMTMQVELLFDDTNIQDAFMMEKFTNATAGAAVTDIAGIVRNAKSGADGDGGYSVRDQIEGMIALITQSETRQVVFYWGDMVFAGEIISVNAKYTMFNPMGHPVRGTVGLTIKEGGPDTDTGNDKYWDDAYEALLKGGGVMGKLGAATSNLLNLK